MLRRTIWWMMPVVAVVLSVVALAHAQDPAPPDVSAIVAAVGSKQWVGVAAGLILVTIYALRGFTTLWDRIPKQYRPAVVAGLGVLSGVAQAIVTGQPWLAALIGGLLSALTAIGTDQVVSKTLAGKPAQRN